MDTIRNLSHNSFQMPDMSDLVHPDFVVASSFHDSLRTEFAKLKLQLKKDETFLSYYFRPAIARADAAVRDKHEQEKAAESARLKAKCGALYGDTAEKKVSDLTVAEAEVVGACQALGVYSRE
jgi:hypothetical protein